MPQYVDVENVGLVEFPDELSQDQIKQFLARDFGPKPEKLAQDLVPAVRKVGGDVAVGEPGDTHPDIIADQKLTTDNIDQRGFVDQMGQFWDRREAAQATGLPTEREPGNLHSTDLPAYKATLPKGIFGAPETRTPEQQATAWAAQAQGLGFKAPEEALESAKEFAEGPRVNIPKAPDVEKAALTLPEQLLTARTRLWGEEAANIHGQINRTIYNQLAGLGDFIFSDEGALSALASLIPVGRLGVTAYFAQDMARSVYEEAKNTYENWDQMTGPQRARAITEAAAAAGMTVMLAKHTMTGKPTRTDIRLGLGRGSSVTGLAKDILDREAEREPVTADQRVEREKQAVDLADSELKRKSRFVNATASGDIAETAPDGTILINRPKFHHVLEKELDPKLPVEAGIRSIINQESIHSVVRTMEGGDQEAAKYWNSLPWIEKQIIARRYLGPGYRKKMRGDSEMGHEAIRFRMERAMNMDPAEFVFFARSERMTSKALTGLEDVVRWIRQKGARRAEEEELLDKVSQNIEAVKKGAPKHAVVPETAQPIRPVRKEPVKGEGKVSEEERRKADDERRRQEGLEGQKEVLLDPQQIVDMPGDEFERRVGHVTEPAYELGATITTPERRAAMEAAKKTLSEQYQEAKKAKDLTAMRQVSSKGQYLGEAIRMADCIKEVIEGKRSVAEVAQERGVGAKYLDRLVRRRQEEAGKVPPQIKVMITKADEAALSALGYSPEQIYTMKPEEAGKILQEKTKAVPTAQPGGPPPAPVTTGKPTAEGGPPPTPAPAAISTATPKAEEVQAGFGEPQKQQLNSLLQASVKGKLRPEQYDQMIALMEARDKAEQAKAAPPKSVGMAMKETGEEAGPERPLTAFQQMTPEQQDAYIAAKRKAGFSDEQILADDEREQQRLDRIYAADMVRQQEKETEMAVEEIPPEEQKSILYALVHGDLSVGIESRITKFLDLETHRKGLTKPTEPSRTVGGVAVPRPVRVDWWYPNLDDLVTYFNHQGIPITHDQLREPWLDKVRNHLLNAPGERIKELARAMKLASANQLRNYDTWRVADPQAPKSKAEYEAEWERLFMPRERALTKVSKKGAMMEAETALPSEQERLEYLRDRAKGDIRAQAERNRLIAEINKRWQAMAEPRGDLFRNFVTIPDIGFDNPNIRFPYRLFGRLGADERFLQKPSKKGFAAPLDEGARDSKYQDASVTHRLTILQAKPSTDKNESVHLCSTYRRGKAGIMIYDPHLVLYTEEELAALNKAAKEGKAAPGLTGVRLGPSGKPHQPLSFIMQGYKVLGSIYVRVPVKNFHMRIDGREGFSAWEEWLDRIGNDANFIMDSSLKDRMEFFSTGAKKKRIEAGGGDEPKELSPEGFFGEAPVSLPSGMFAGSAYPGGTDIAKAQAGVLRINMNTWSRGPVRTQEARGLGQVFYDWNIGRAETPGEGIADLEDVFSAAPYVDPETGEKKKTVSALYAKKYAPSEVQVIDPTTWEVLGTKSTIQGLAPYEVCSYSALDKVVRDNYLKIVHTEDFKRERAAIRKLYPEGEKREEQLEYQEAIAQITAYNKSLNELYEAAKKHLKETADPVEREAQLDDFTNAILAAHGDKTGLAAGQPPGAEVPVAEGKRPVKVGKGWVQTPQGWQWRELYRSGTVELTARERVPPTVERRMGGIPLRRRLGPTPPLGGAPPLAPAKLPPGAEEFISKQKPEGLIAEKQAETEVKRYIPKGPYWEQVPLPERRYLTRKGELVTRGTLARAAVGRAPEKTEVQKVAEAFEKSGRLPPKSKPMPGRGIVPPSQGQMMLMDDKAFGKGPAMAMKEREYGTSRATQNLRGSAFPSKDPESLMDAAESAREILKNNPYAPYEAEAYFERKKFVSIDYAKAVWAMGEAATHKSDRVADNTGWGSPQHDIAEKERQRWTDLAQRMSSPSGFVLNLSRSVINLDTGSFYAMGRAVEEGQNKPLTPAQTAKIKKIQKESIKGSEELLEAIKKTESALRMVDVEDAPPALKSAVKKINDDPVKAKADILSRIRSRMSPGMAAKGVRKPKGMARADWEDMVAYGGIKISEGVTDKIQWMSEMVKETGFKDKMKLEKIWEASTEMGELIDALQPTRAKQVDIALLKETGSKWTPARARNLWRYVKKYYIDQGELDFDRIQKGVAKDLGIHPNDINRGLASRKTIREVTDQMYYKMAQQRRVVDQAKNWVKNQQYPMVVKAFRMVPRIFFADKIFGHGTVGMVTHAGNMIFDPYSWKAYWPTWLDMYKMANVFNKKAATVAWEKSMRQLMLDDNFIKAKRAGLQVDPFRYTDDYTQVWMGNWLAHATGGKGFDALKILRMKRWNQLWDATPPNLKEGEVGKEMASLYADMVNHATGIVKGRGYEWMNWGFFAPKLEGSRWAFLIGDPVKAARILATRDRATPAQLAWAKQELFQKLGIAITYSTFLAMNQGMIMAYNAWARQYGAEESDQSVNFLDPSKADFWQFKLMGHRIGLAGPLLGIVRLAANLCHAAWGEQTPFERGEGRRAGLWRKEGEYIAGKFSPVAGFALEAGLGEDYAGRPLPWTTRPVPAKFRSRGIDRFGWGEWTLKEFLPIPLQEGAMELFHIYGENDDVRAGDILQALTVAGGMAATGARITEDVQK